MNIIVTLTHSLQIDEKRLNLPNKDVAGVSLRPPQTAVSSNVLREVVPQPSVVLGRRRRRRGGVELFLEKRGRSEGGEEGERKRRGEEREKLERRI